MEKQSYSHHTSFAFALVLSSLFCVLQADFLRASSLSLSDWELFSLLRSNPDSLNPSYHEVVELLLSNSSVHRRVFGPFVWESSDSTVTDYRIHVAHFEWLYKETIAVELHYSGEKLLDITMFTDFDYNTLTEKSGVVFELTNPQALFYLLSFSNQFVLYTIDWSHWFTPHGIPYHHVPRM